MNEPTDPWAPGVRASDVPVMNGGDPNPLDTAEFEATDAPLPSEEDEDGNIVPSAELDDRSDDLDESVGAEDIGGPL